MAAEADLGVVGAMTPLFTCLMILVGSVACANTGYLLLLLTAAALARRDANRRKAVAINNDDAAAPRVVIVVPAHNEEAVLGATLRSLDAQHYPKERLECVVVADNCTDRTASIASQSGATVLERVDLEKRGKGYALNWATATLLSRPNPPDIVIIVDADTWVAPEFTRLMATALWARRDERDCCVLQGRYGVLNVRDGWRATLMAAAFDLFNHVRPLGSERLGLSVGLKGNGMGFTRAVLERSPWGGRSITEDIDYGLDLLSNHGIRVGYLPQACVLAQMPVAGAPAASQRERWERGRYALLRERVRPLLTQGLRKRDYRLCDAAIQLLMLPLAELCGTIVGWGALLAVGAGLGMLPIPFLGIGLWIATVLGLLLYVVGGLAVAEAPREVYAALLRAPIYACWKFCLYLTPRIQGSGRGRGAEWVRTERLPISDLSGEGRASQAPAAVSER